MPQTITIDNLGGVGLIIDIGESDQPINSLSKCENIRCKNGYLTPFGGYKIYADLSSITGEAFYLLSQQTATDYNYIFPCDIDDDGIAEKIYKFDGIDLTNITRQAGTPLVDVDYTSDIQWNGCTLNGLSVLNNGLDNPQILKEDDAQFSDMIYSGSTTWASQGYIATVIRAHKNFLVALRITESGQLYRNMVHWSSVALPGEQPSSWDYTDITELSNRVVLAQTDGEVIDGLSLRDDFIVYKEDSVFVLSSVNDPTYVFLARPLFSDRGIFAQDCVCDIGGRHFVVGDGRVYIHDGSTAQDVMSGRVADDFFGKIDSVNYKLTFCFFNRVKSEVVICFPDSGSDRCNSSYVYNVDNNTWTTKSVNNLFFAKIGSLVFSTGQPSDFWDSESDSTWDSEVSQVWKVQVFSPINDTLIGAGKGLWQLDTGLTDDGLPIELLAEKTGILLGGENKWNEIVSVTPRTEGSGEILLQIGKQSSPESRDIFWSPARAIVPGENRRIPFKIISPCFGWRIVGTGEWKLSSLTIEYEPGGYR